ncbi:MAG TPA: toll/interleukin-1 receptor domain-containing protein [Pyrinomonadaceae bacterium]|nr:toll/interleukin-1 receptor domain-containing protein [Pyrinomonadaceae bacterium]
MTLKSEMIFCSECGSILDATSRRCRLCDAPVPVTPATSIEVFISYSHKDEGLKERLVTHLASLQSQGVITTWHGRLIKPGEDWSTTIDEHLNSATVILLLVSADFIASAYCNGVEVKRALERHAERTALVIPVILSPAVWEGTKFGRLQALPRDGKPVTTWTNRNKAFEDITRGLKRALEGFVVAPSPETLKPRRVDAAIPSDASIGEHLDLLVQVRLPSSPLLGSEDWGADRRPHSVTQTSSETNLRFPVDRRTGIIGPARLEIHVIAPDFEIGGAPQKFIEVPPDQASEMVRFLLTARQIGTCKINVEVYSGDQTYLGAIPLETNIARGSLSRSLNIANLVLAVMVEPADRLDQDEGSTGVAPNVGDSETADSSGAESRSHRLRLKVLMALISIVAVLMAAAYWRFVYDQPVTAPAKIAITEIPPYDPVGGPDTSANIAGVASGVDSQDVRVVIYSFTDKWYVEPSEAEPFTSVGGDGRWSSTIRTGTKYAALLVRSTFKPRTKIPNLPNVEGEVLAIQVEPGRQ